MSISMLGKPLKDEYFFDLPYDYYVGTKERDGEDYVDFNKGMHLLHDIISLWHLVDENRAEELKHFIYKVLQVEIRDRENIFPDEEKYGYLLLVEDVRELYEMIGNIDGIVEQEFTEKDPVGTLPKYYVLPEKEAFVREKLGRGRESYPHRLNLQNEIYSVGRIKQFLKTAIDHNRELVIG